MALIRKPLKGGYCPDPNDKDSKKKKKKTDKKKKEKEEKTWDAKTVHALIQGLTAKQKDLMTLQVTQVASSSKKEEGSDSVNESEMSEEDF